MKSSTNSLILLVLLASCGVKSSAPPPDDGRYTYCEVHGPMQYCSKGGDASIVKLPTGEIACGTGACQRNSIGGYLCAPPHSSITTTPRGPECRTLEGKRIDCRTPSPQQCDSRTR